MDARTLRIAGWAGIVFSVLSLIVIPLVLSLPPPLGSSGAAFAAWYAEHRLGFLIGNYLGVAAFFPGFVQLAVLAACVRRLEGGADWLASLVLATGAFTYAVFACSLVVYQVLPFLVGPQLESAAEAMGSLGAVWFALDGLAALPLVLSVGWATMRTGALPRWFAHLSWLVAAIAVVMSLGGLTATPAWLAGGGLVTAIGFIVFFAWTFAIGVIFLSLDPAKQGLADKT
jgi:hypothetical protein